MNIHLASRIEKVPRDIRDEKSGKSWQVRDNWSQPLEHMQVPKKSLTYRPSQFYLFFEKNLSKFFRLLHLKITTDDLNGEGSIVPVTSLI